MWYSITAGFGLGLLGSFHCVGMCGPIALSLPIYGKTTIQKLMLIVLYNLGRATSYSLLGALFGFIGNQFFLFGYQQVFSVIVGLLLLVVFLFSKIYSGSGNLLDVLLSRVKRKLGQVLQTAQSESSYFIIGLLNGLLPCGLVYLAIASAMATGSVWSGAALMMMFGFGTFPLMIAVMIFGKFLPLSIRLKVQKVMPIFIVFTAVLIIARGMNLGIPYLSPVLKNSNNSSVVECHK